MKELIKKIQKDWETAKADAQSSCASAGNLELAQKLGACDMFKGTEDLEQLINLMFTPKGVEFLTAFNFPDLATFRKFKKYHPERLGVYIDCGKIALDEPKRAFLVGNTTATVKCRELQATRLVLMHGAEADITASGYAVVKIERDATAEVRYEVKDHAKVLI